MIPSSLHFFKPLTDIPSLSIEKAHGIYLYTKEGKKIIDAASGAVVVNIGQGREELAEIALEQIRNLNYIFPLWTSKPLEDLVKRLSSWFSQTYRFYFTTGGAESVESALRFTFLYQAMENKPWKNKILSRYTSYHGTTLGALSASGNFLRRKNLEHCLFDWPKIPPPYCYRCPWSKTYPSCGIACAEVLEELLNEETAKSIAGFIAEPIIGASGGAIVPVDEYWPKVAEICKKHELLLIIDEVMTGFGRTGKRFAFEHWKLEPDIIVCAKGLSSGYSPMGMIAVKEELVQKCEQKAKSFMFYTYTSNPLGCTVANKVLEIIESERLIEHSNRIGAFLGESLKKALSDHPLVGDIRGKGLFWGVEIVRNKQTKEPFDPKEGCLGKIITSALELGVFFYPCQGMVDGVSGEALLVCPPFTVTEAEIINIVDVLKESLDRLKQALAMT
ncbi:aminotransferase class III-fold pyridoxal phosphate-dependent enzyme [Methylacidiphilum caldifontis]|uniref:Adenosylmethionine-8-amino-7-oxononanoate aminotransferase n=2 Tax=Methylacidiphilum caldifontis TaxID=2795386 RepID=A0A4Y8P937_9BACT|nr:aminotransferase class III-fold pyridoxal phosphate-dependent enzyme [Methylacidiphilum caldifontis]TFE66912.1 adenosylmethionine-8-amino-7-oxononanoate aminotransferase [Methylacidiphilum caldifontis]